MSDDSYDEASTEAESVTEEEAVVQTPHGERYKAHVIDLTGHPIDDE